MLLSLARVMCCLCRVTDRNLPDSNWRSWFAASRHKLHAVQPGAETGLHVKREINKLVYTVH